MLFVRRRSSEEFDADQAGQVSLLAAGVELVDGGHEARGRLKG